MLMQIITSNAFIMLDNNKTKANVKCLWTPSRAKKTSYMCQKRDLKGVFQMKRKAIINIESSPGAKRATLQRIQHRHFCTVCICLALVSSTRQQLSLHVFTNSHSMYVGVLIYSAKFFYAFFSFYFLHPKIASRSCSVCIIFC